MYESPADAAPAAPDSTAPQTEPQSAPPVDRAPEQGGGDSATPGVPQTAAPAAPAVPAYQQPHPQQAHVDAALQQVAQLEHALGLLEQRDRELAAWGDQLPEAMRAEMQQRAAAFPLARQQLQTARAAAQVEQQRLALEAPSRHVIQTFLIDEAVKQVPTLDRQQMYRQLSAVQAPDDVPIVANQLVELHLQHLNGQRAATGADFMGGTGGAAPPQDLSKLDENELFRMDAAALRRRR